MNQHRSGATLVFLIVMMLVDVLLTLVISSSRGLPGGMEVVFVGCIGGLVCGQSIFAFVWSGLVGGSWLRSYFQAVGLAALAIFLVIMATVLGSNFGPTNWTRPLCTLLMIPLFGIIGSVPLWAIRYLLGWRLLYNSQSTEKPKAVGVEDILLLTATVAGALMLTRAAIVIMMSETDSTDDAWQSTMIVAVILGAISAPFSLGNAWLFFKSETSQARFLKMSGFGLATWILAIATIGVLAQGGGAAEAIVALMFLILTGFGTLFFGLSCLTADGLKLHRRGKKPVQTASTVLAPENSTVPIDCLSESSLPLIELPPSELQPRPVALASEEPAATLSTTSVDNSIAEVASDPFAADEDSIESSQSANSSTGNKRHLDRMLVGALVATAVFFTAIAHRKETREQELVRVREDSLNSLRDQATEVVIENGDDVERFRGKPNVDDSIADELDRYSGLKVVDLTGCRNITDRGATQIAKLPSLDRLILSGTSVSDNLFESLIPGEFSLKELDLSNTKVTVAGIKKMFGIIRCQKLSLRGLNLSDADIKQLESLECNEWDLRDNPISIVPAKANTLALGESSIDLSQLNDVASYLRVLKIDGIKLTDDEFIALLDQLPSLRYLSLTGTGLTDKSLDHIAEIDMLETLEIGPGNFTGNAVFPKDFTLSMLRISHPNLSLVILKALGPQIRMIDLSHSGVTDADIESIKNLQYVSYRLDQTQVTIKSIKHLMGLNAREISIRGTAITPADFEQLSGGAYFARVIVDEIVFTDRVKKKLQRSLPIKFEDNLMFQFDDGY